MIFTLPNPAFNRTRPKRRRTLLASVPARRLTLRLDRLWQSSRGPQMRILVVTATYILSAALLAVIGLSALMALAAEGHRPAPGELATFLFVFCGWITIFGLPGYLAAFLWRRLGKKAHSGERARTPWLVLPAFALTLGLAAVLHVFDCRAAAVQGECVPTLWRVILYASVFVVPVHIFLLIVRTAADQVLSTLKG